ncbi:TPA: hypothetical protein UL242_002422 [Clostridioides difficile]|nr:hypothetical protein [Clostridioides difficile]HEL2860321.1 hypothetical protein [Clostridioides difficile]
MYNKYMFDELKANARISKSKIKEIISVFKKKIDVIKINDNGLSKLEKELGLTKNNYTKIISSNKSLIKQYLLYHFLPFANDCFVRKNISYQDIAKLCNISIVTARNNQKTLSYLGLAYFTPSSNYGRFDIVIADEYKNHYKKEKGGSGYITLTLNHLVHLINLKNVNELKLELKKLLWIDACKAKGKKIRFSKDKLVDVLPLYIKKSDKFIFDILSSKNTKFKIVGDSLETKNYESKSEFNKKFVFKVSEKIRNLFEQNNYSYSYNHSKLLLQKNPSNEDLRKLEGEKALIINDLACLSLEFGVRKVYLGLDHMFKNTIYNEDININKIKNPAGFLRNFIEKKLITFGSLY